MFTFLLLAATLTFDFSVKAEELNEPPKCNEKIINKIYTYWQNNGGVPQQINENNNRCYTREFGILASPGMMEDGVTCAALDHFLNSSTLYLVRGNNVSTFRDIVTEEENGQLINPTNKNVRFEIATSGCARLLHMCGRESKATVMVTSAGGRTTRPQVEFWNEGSWHAKRAEVLEGPGNFAIKSIDGKATKEDIKAMKDLLANTFDFHETLETFSESCPLPEEKPQPVGPCAKRSCTN